MPRAHWRKLAVAIGRMGAGELGRRWQAGQHLIQAHGITYNVYGDAQGMERPWSLDPIPLIMDPHEWAGLEREADPSGVLRPDWTATDSRTDRGVRQ